MVLPLRVVGFLFQKKKKQNQVLLCSVNLNALLQIGMECEPVDFTMD